MCLYYQTIKSDFRAYRGDILICFIILINKKGLGTRCPNPKTLDCSNAGLQYYALKLVGTII